VSLCRRATPLLVAALVSACATTRIEPPPSGAVPDAQQVSTWQARGRLAVSAQGQGGSGTFTWHQQAERTELSVRGPLGVGALDVVSDGQALTVSDGSGRSYDGDAARAALEQKLGVGLPVGQMRYWMLGIPAPSVAAGSVAPDPTAATSPSGFTQDGWTVSLDEMRTVGAWRLPARLSASSQNVRVRMVVDDWQIPGTP
jgi:outer membrane lipoprotein LolB